MTKTRNISVYLKGDLRARLDAKIREKAYLENRNITTTDFVTDIIEDYLKRYDTPQIHDFSESNP